MKTKRFRILTDSFHGGGSMIEVLQIDLKRQEVIIDCGTQCTEPIGEAGLMEWIGTDDNGKDIWEDDICEHIRWDETGYDPFIADLGLLYNEYDPGKIRVIGNKHQNPELVAKTK